MTWQNVTDVYNKLSCALFTNSKILYCLPPSLSACVLIISAIKFLELPAAKRQKGITGSVISTAFNAAVIGAAVGLTMFRMWVGQLLRGPWLTSGRAGGTVVVEILERLNKPRHRLIKRNGLPRRGREDLKTRQGSGGEKTRRRGTRKKSGRVHVRRYEEQQEDCGQFGRGFLSRHDSQELGRSRAAKLKSNMQWTLSRTTLASDCLREHVRATLLQTRLIWTLRSLCWTVVCPTLA